MDTIPRYISAGFYQSQLGLLQSLFPEGICVRSVNNNSYGYVSRPFSSHRVVPTIPGNPNRTLRQPTSASSNIRMQLQSLLSLIKDRRSHYVFCIKPNESKKANLFELPLVQHQVRYTNIMPLVNIWRTGYCFHLSHMNFLNRYKILHRETWPVYRVGGLIEGIATIIRELPLPAAEFVLGTTKIFMRSPRTVLTSKYL